MSEENKPIFDIGKITSGKHHIPAPSNNNRAIILMVITLVIFLFFVVPLYKTYIKETVEYEQKIVDKYQKIGYTIDCLGGHVFAIKDGYIAQPIGRAGSVIHCENVTQTALKVKPKKAEVKTTETKTKVK